MEAPVRETWQTRREPSPKQSWNLPDLDNAKSAVLNSFGQSLTWLAMDVTFEPCLFRIGSSIDARTIVQFRCYRRNGDTVLLEDEVCFLEFESFWVVAPCSRYLDSSSLVVSVC